MNYNQDFCGVPLDNYEFLVTQDAITRFTAKFHRLTLCATAITTDHDYAASLFFLRGKNNKLRSDRGTISVYVLANLRREITKP
jgi:hypothetical protein